MRDKLITVTCIVLFALLLAAVAPRINALAAEMGSQMKTLECAPGATIVNLENGGIRVTGMCSMVEAPRVNDAELEPMRAGDAEASESYVSAYPDPAYPDPEPDSCDWVWYLLGFCEE
jgi:hypothetical protein